MMLILLGWIVLYSCRDVCENRLEEGFLNVEYFFYGKMNEGIFFDKDI